MPKAPGAPHDLADAVSSHRAAGTKPICGKGRLLPAVTEAQQADLLARQCRLYNRRGIGVVRDPGLMPGEVAVYQAVADRGELTTRTRLMFWVMHPGLPPGTLVIEHAFLADEQARARAVRLGVGITVQHPLLYSLGGNLVRYWGPDRASQVMPVRAWVDEGALIAAGSDCNVSFFDPLLSIWGLVTRGTRTVGVQGPEYRVDTYTAIRLYTAAGGQLLRESRSVGILAPGAFADIVGFRADLLDCPVDDLPSQQPALTLVGGRPVHDPDGLLGSAGSA